VQLETHATPFDASPQQRYATLHRAIEQGRDSDDVWCELALVSSKMGHHDEAKRCALRVRNTSRLAPSLRKLVGVIDHTDVIPTGAPAASDAGPTEKREDHPNTSEFLADAAQFMVYQHMPWLVLITMMSFPLTVGLGGSLINEGSLLMLAAMAALPLLTIVTVIAAMCHEVLRSSSNGHDDVPDIPEFGRLLHGSRSFLIDASLIASLYVGLPYVLATTVFNWSTILPVMTLGILITPLAFSLQQLRRDYCALSPIFMAKAVRRAGYRYFVISLAITAAFTPALLALLYVGAHPLWLQISIVGPMCVIPILAASRLMGSWIDANRDHLGDLLIANITTVTDQPAAEYNRATKPTARSAQRAERTEPSRKRRQAHPKAQEAGLKHPQPSMAASKTDSQPPTPAPTPRAIAGRPPELWDHRKAKSDHPQTHNLQDVPDLGHMPGAVIVTGTDRAREGAASRR
jgi:hypothetical protein